MIDDDVRRRVCPTLTTLHGLQTQWSNLAGGTARFSPHLTRLFCSASAPAVASCVISALVAHSITHAIKPIGEDTHDVLSPSGSLAHADDDAMDIDDMQTGKTHEVGNRGARIRVSTTDRRKCALRGEIWIESVAAEDSDRQETQADNAAAKTIVLMRRSKGDPLEWRRLFRAIATADGMRDLIVTA